jgi:hypothetical protein
MLAIFLAAFGIFVASNRSFGQNLRASGREVTVGRNGSNKPVAKWENGLMLAYDQDVQPPVVTIFGSDGREVTQASIAVPDAARVWIHSVAAAPDGRTAVGGVAMKADGSVASFLAWLTQRGGIERMVRTSPLTPRRLSFASDGTLWAAVLGPSEGKNVQPHDVLLHYDKSGKLMGSFLRSTEFTRYSQEEPAEDSFLTASEDKVGFYSASARAYVELDVSGAVLGRWSGLPSDRSLVVTGAGMVRGGITYLSARRAIPGKPGYTAAEYFVLNREPGTWTRVDVSGLVGAIDGTENEHLIIGAGNSRYLWVSAR